MTESPQTSVRPSTVEEIRANGGMELFRLHSQESEPGLTAFLDPDWDTYLAKDEAGELIVLGAWAGDKLVGYVVAWVLESAHYRGRVLVQQDVLFVAPSYRAHGLGLRLVKALREEANERGASQLLMHAKVGSKLVGVLEVAGLTPEEVVFKEELCPTPEPR